MLSLSREFLFIHVPKTAGNAIQNALRQFTEDQFVVVNPDYQDGYERFEVRNPEFPNLHKHSTLEDYRRALGEERLRRLFKFTCVRNPWDRAISYYFSPHRGRQDWDRGEFIRFIQQVAPAVTFLQTEVGQSIAMDAILRYESLDSDFAALCTRLGLGDPALPRVNVSRSEPYAGYYDEELVELVRRRFADDINAFGYSFGPSN
jgi:hypothetical protein